jgi:hypothetical protein
MPDSVEVAGPCGRGQGRSVHVAAGCCGRPALKMVWARWAHVEDGMGWSGPQEKIEFKCKHDFEFGQDLE